MSKKVTEVQVAQENVSEQKEEEQIAVPSKREILAMFVNDAVQVGTNVPVGGWFVKFTDWRNNMNYGPYPLMVKTRKGQVQFQGFVPLDSLRAAAEYLWEHEVVPGTVDPGLKLDLSSGSNKMMSCWINRE